MARSSNVDELQEMINRGASLTNRGNVGRSHIGQGSCPPSTNYRGRTFVNEQFYSPVQQGRHSRRS